MVRVEGAVIVVPDELKERILRDGYRCSLRKRVPCSRNRDAALQAFRRFYPNKVHAFLEVIKLPPGVDAEDHKDGIKINTSHLPATYIRAVGLSSPWPQSPSPAFTPAPALSPALAPRFSPLPRAGGVDLHPRELALEDIYYTQDSIADHFQDGRLLTQTRNELQAREKSVHDIPLITVVWHKNKWFCVDNRRLCVYKRVYPATFKVPVRCGVQDDRFFNKLKQPQGGTSIFVRGRGFR